jgi:hypothetical protein
MMMAKPSTMIDLGSRPDCSFADILKRAKQAHMPRSIAR